MNITGTKNGQAQTSEGKIRITALLVLLVTVTYWLTGAGLITIFLVVDFSLRAFDLGKFSPLSLLSSWLVQCFKVPFKAVYLPPKRFAARIGLVFSAAIFVLHFLGLNSLPVSVVLAFFAALESFFGFCAGCHVYNFITRFKK